MHAPGREPSRHGLVPGHVLAPRHAPLPAPPDAAGSAAGSRSFAALRAEAARALAEGRLADSVRLAWLAALALVDQAGVSAAIAARADWEHVEAARRQRRELGEPLAALALEFQRARFGGAPLAPANADRCLALLASLERTLGG